MSERQFSDAYRLGYGDGRQDGLKKARFVALATWPLAGIAWALRGVF